jgi:molybdopterin converting factor small subunit
MSTKNQRVAAYFPGHIHKQLQAFKAERAIKGDSQALIVILSEFFGVEQEVAHQSSSTTLDLQKRVSDLEEKIAQLKDALLDELRRELLNDRSASIDQAKAEVKDELLSELKGESLKTSVADGQLELIPDKELSLPYASSELLSEPQGELPDMSEESGWITTKEAFDTLNPTISYSTFRRLSPEKLHKIYGLQVDPQRKEKNKHNAKWLRFSNAVELSQVSSATEKTESELLSELNNELPEF